MKNFFNCSVSVVSVLLLSLILISQTPERVQAQSNGKVLQVGSRLELFVDRYLIEELKGANLKLHSPRATGSVLRFDKPWEGKYCGYVTVIKDDVKYRIYYRGLPESGKDGSNKEATCYAESSDGINWVKPDLKIYRIDGTFNNNVILRDKAPFSHNFSPFLDRRPDVLPSRRFKAIAGVSKSGLGGFISPDGIHWKKVRADPIITYKSFAFDSQNVGFWSEVEKCYVCYFRTWSSGFRTISRTTSQDFLNWTKPVEMKFGDTKREHLYTNQTAPYFRAPHIYLSIAARFMPGRRVVSANEFKKLGGDAAYSGDCSDAVFMTSRGGDIYDRTFMEAFIRPGIGKENWTSRTNYPAYGIVQTAPCEMSFYLQRRYGQTSHFLERFTMRLDGFVSVNAPYNGGELLTKPFCFEGNKLLINFATSAAGEIRVEIQDRSGNPIEGYGLKDSVVLIGDSIERTVTWKKKSDVKALAKEPIRLKFVLKDCDLFSIRFCAEP